jgi:hypothetical protein
MDVCWPPAFLAFFSAHRSCRARGVLDRWQSSLHGCPVQCLFVATDARETWAQPVERKDRETENKPAEAQLFHQDRVMPGRGFTGRIRDRKADGVSPEVVVIGSVKNQHSVRLGHELAGCANGLAGRSNGLVERTTSAPSAACADDGVTRYANATSGADAARHHRGDRRRAKASRRVSIGTRARRVKSA